MGSPFAVSGKRAEALPSVGLLADALDRLADAMRQGASPARIAVLREQCEFLEARAVTQMKAYERLLGRLVTRRLPDHSYEIAANAAGGFYCWTCRAYCRIGTDCACCANRQTEVTGA